jgi:hypothetical protein
MRLGQFATEGGLETPGTKEEPREERGGLSEWAVSVGQGTSLIDDHGQCQDSFPFGCFQGQILVSPSTLWWSST